MNSHLAYSHHYIVKTPNLFVVVWRIHWESVGTDTEKISLQKMVIYLLLYRLEKIKEYIQMQYFIEFYLRRADRGGPKTVKKR